MKQIFLIAFISIAIISCKKEAPVENTEVIKLPHGLSKSQLSDIEHIQKVFSEVEHSSLEKTIDKFRRDENPASEIKIEASFTGEEYRNYLQRLIKTLDLADHVLFLNEFVDQKELFKYLAATDVYITPYTNEAQITSGTLAYALGVGCAVLSTPYWYATELLANGRGHLFGFNNSDELAGILLKLFDHQEQL